EPFATAHTTGSSRSALTPATCWALRARSSPSTPAVFLVATLVITETSSSRVAMSSNRAKKLEGMGWREAGRGSGSVSHGAGRVHVGDRAKTEPDPLPRPPSSLLRGG